MWGALWGALWSYCVGSCWGSWVEGGAVWVDVWGKLLKDCVGELGKLCVVETCGGAVWLGGWGYMSVGHAHHSPDGPGIHTPLPPVLPAQGGFPTTLSPTAPIHAAPPPVPIHSGSQVVHCRVCPPHPLHAPVLVLHLAVYPASPTQGRVGLTDRLTHRLIVAVATTSNRHAPLCLCVPSLFNYSLF